MRAHVHNEYAYTHTHTHEHVINDKLMEESMKDQRQFYVREQTRQESSSTRPLSKIIITRTGGVLVSWR